MVVDRDRQYALGFRLPNDILIKQFIDLMRLGQRAVIVIRLLLHFLGNDVITQIDTLITDEHGRARNQLAHFVLALATE